MAMARIPRYSAFGLSLISFDTAPTNTNCEVIPFTAEDRGESKSVLYTRGGEKTVVTQKVPTTNGVWD